MKKIFVGLFAVLIASVSFASSWTAPTTYPVSITQAPNTSIKIDSITGIDSITMFSNVTVDPTSTYALQTLDSIASGDSVYIFLRMYNSNGKLINAITADTIVQSTTYKTTALPVNKTAFGMKMTIKAKGAVAVLKRIFKAYSLLIVSPVEPYKVNVFR